MRSSDDNLTFNAGTQEKMERYRRQLLAAGWREPENQNLTGLHWRFFCAENIVYCILTASCAKIKRIPTDSNRHEICAEMQTPSGKTQRSVDECWHGYVYLENK